MRHLLFALIIILGSAGWVSGQPYRETLPISQVEIFQRMLVQTEEGNFDKVDKGTIFLDPLFSALQLKFGVNFKARFQDKVIHRDKAGLEASILHLAFLDLIDLLEVAGQLLQKNDLDRAKSKIKVAFQDYLILTPFILNKAFPADQKIKNDFRVLTLGSESTLRPEEYKRLTAEIQQLIVSAYPEYKIR